jgi:DNA-binding NarL/FixJ family response regulator
MALQGAEEGGQLGAEPLQVLIVDDHLAVGHGIELLLGEAGFGIARHVDRPAVARSVLLHGRYDVAMLEIHLCNGDGLGLARDLLRERPEAPLLLYTGHTDPVSDLRAAIEVGAPGVVLTSSTPKTLADAVHVVAAGGVYRDPELAVLLASPAADRLAVLSPREREILGLLADGYSGPEIAERLFLSLETVRTHIRNATTKLGARTRVQAAALVACNGATPHL